MVIEKNWIRMREGKKTEQNKPDGEKKSKDLEGHEG